MITRPIYRPLVRPASGIVMSPLIAELDDLKAYYSGALSTRDMGAGSSVLRWRNLVGSLHYSQGVPSLQPTFNSTGISSRPAIQFNGSSQYFTSVDSLAGESEFDIYVVASIGSHGGGGSVLFGGRTSGNEDALIVEVTVSGLPRFIYNGTVLSISDLMISTSTPFILRMNFDGTTMRVYKNGVQSADTATSSGVVSMISRALGVLLVGGSPLTSYMSGLISEACFFNKIKSTEENASILDFFSKFYSITIG